MEVSSIFFQTFLPLTLLSTFGDGFPNGYSYENPNHSLENLPKAAQPSGFSKTPAYPTQPEEVPNLTHPAGHVEVYASNNIAVPLNGIGEAVSAKIEQVINSKSIDLATPFPNTGRQKAVLESSAKESIPIQVDIKYGSLQNFVADFLHPKPIVDTIQEHEKYGNSGDKSRALGVFVVNAFEGISNAVNAAVDAPVQAIKTKGRQLTAALNQVGGKLVGLAK